MALRMASGFTGACFMRGRRDALVAVSMGSHSSIWIYRGGASQNSRNLRFLKIPKKQ
jgi:hypothetical protein